MSFDTIGFNYFPNYVFPVSVSEGLTGLKKQEAANFFKIVFIKNGSCHFSLNGKEFILTGASTICLNHRDEIKFLKISEELVKILWFRPSAVNSLFTLELIDNASRKLSDTEVQDMYYMMQFLPEASPSLKILSLHTIDSALIEHKLQLLMELLTRQDTVYWPCRSRSYLFEILFCLARQEEEEEINPVQPYNDYSRLAINVIYYLQSCYHQKITIEQLADEFHTNRTSLLNDFKKYTGQSINQYLIQLRLTMASTLLRDTTLTIEEICERTGFHDNSYFSKVFKKKLHMTPTEYRKIYNHLV